MTEAQKIALVTGANQGIGLHVAESLVAKGWTVYVGSRNEARGEAAAAEIGAGATAIQIDVTDAASIAAAAARIRTECGHLDLLVNNAAISRPAEMADLAFEDVIERLVTTTISLDAIRAIWETNVFGVVAVTQEMLPLLRAAKAGRIVMVSSGVGSLSENSDPDFPYRKLFTPGYAASKTALNAIGLSFAIALEDEGIRVNMASPGFTRTNLNGYRGTEEIEDGAREVVRVALLDDDSRNGAFTGTDSRTIPW